MLGFLQALGYYSKCKGVEKCVISSVLSHSQQNLGKRMLRHQRINTAQVLQLYVTVQFYLKNKEKIHLQRHEDMQTQKTGREERDRESALGERYREKGGPLDPLAPLFMFFSPPLGPCPM